MRKILVLSAIISLLSFRGSAQVPTWSTSVSHIVYNNCSVCHHTGAIAPFALMSYDDAVYNAFNIQADVTVRKMPPWPPDPNYNHLYHERVLAQEDIDSINAWVNGGMPRGDSLLEPAPPVFDGDNSQMVNASDSIEFPAYQIVDVNGLDVFRTFVVHSNWTQTRYINEIEFIPSNDAVVHHVFLYYDHTDQSFMTDSLYPGAGFPGGGQGGFSDSSVYLAGYTPGSTMLQLPYNMGFKVPAGSDFALTIHYAPGSNGLTNSMKVKVKFCDLPDSLIRPVFADRWLYWHYPSLIDGPLFIPPNVVKSFHEKSDTFATDVSLIQAQPHSHLICSSWKVYMVTAPGDTTNLIYIPHWDFNWQMGYLFTKVVKVPAGALIWGEAYFDNTTNNPNNPNNPPQPVYAGESTYDEMMAVRVSYMDYQPGDENIVIDSAFYGLLSGEPPPDIHNLPLNVFPNPANTVIGFMTSLPEHQVHWSLTDVRGMEVRSMINDDVPKGVYAQQIDVSSLAPGMYFLNIQSGDEHTVEKVEIVR